jgi:hypothetical protein
MAIEGIFIKEKNDSKKELPAIHPNLSESEFLSDWNKQYGNFVNPLYKKRLYYQAPSGSMNAEFSSKGWKLHIQFIKGHERELAELLNKYGQFFKIEGEIGTYFNGLNDSGATIYVGSRANLDKLVNLIEEKCSHLPTDNNYTGTMLGEYVYGGSGSDEPLGRGIAGRFDVQKSQFSKKYSQYGFSTSLGFRGLPVLEKNALRVRNLESILQNDEGNATLEQKESAYVELQEIFKETEQEVIKDFGSEFVYGKTLSI